MPVTVSPTFTFVYTKDSFAAARNDTTVSPYIELSDDNTNWSLSKDNGDGYFSLAPTPGKGATSVAISELTFKKKDMTINIDTSSASGNISVDVQAYIIYSKLTDSPSQIQLNWVNQNTSIAAFVKLPDAPNPVQLNPGPNTVYTGD
jgi:hypothetical protein